MDKDIIYKKIKTAKLHGCLTNCYSASVVGNSRSIWECGDEFLFSYEDHGVSRLVFFAETWKGVDRLLWMIDRGRYYLEFMTKNPMEYVPDRAMLTASMKRIANPDCRSVFDISSQVIKFRNSAGVEIAGESDTKEINKMLWGAFHTEISHLLSDEELREKICQGQITVHRNLVGQIDALLQADVMPKKFYINQIINNAGKNVIHAILLNRLGKYIESGGRYLYAWVEDKNIASLKFHEKYGMEHDGMFSMIYCLEK